MPSRPQHGVVSALAPAVRDPAVRDQLVRCRLQSLQECCDGASLRSALGELCAEFGKVTRIDILTMAEAQKRQALCFLRLESQAQEMRLMASLGISRFGDDLLVIVDLSGSAAGGFRL
jgi:hypothetical protein